MTVEILEEVEAVEEVAEKSTALATWDEELAKFATQAAAMEVNAGGGQFFSTQGGILSWMDSPIPGNQMAVIILDSVMENVYYESHYDPSTPSSPTCFGFARDEKDMKPHKLVIEAGNAQHKQCAGCEFNEFGSANVGKGKACRNTRRLAMIPAGVLKDGGFELNTSKDHYETTPVGFMKLPVTSVKGYATFVKQVAGALKRPPFGIVTRVKITQGSPFKVVFEPIMNVPDELMGVIMKRHSETQSIIDFPYPVDLLEKPAKRAPQKRAARKY